MLTKEQAIKRVFMLLEDMMDEDPDDAAERYLLGELDDINCLVGEATVDWWIEIDNGTQIILSNEVES